MVLVVPSVQVHVVRVKQKVGKQQHDHFNGVFPAIYKVPVKHVRSLRRRKAILNERDRCSFINVTSGHVYYRSDAKSSDKYLQTNHLYLIEYEKQVIKLPMQITYYRRKIVKLRKENQATANK